LLSVQTKLNVGGHIQRGLHVRVHMAQAWGKTWVWGQLPRDSYCLPIDVVGCRRKIRIVCGRKKQAYSDGRSLKRRWLSCVYM